MYDVLYFVLLLAKYRSVRTFSCSVNRHNAYCDIRGGGRGLGMRLAMDIGCQTKQLSIT